MFNFLKNFTSYFGEFLHEKFSDLNIDRRDYEATFPEKEEYGDVSITVCQSLAGKLKKSPKIIADDIIEEFETNEDIEKIDNLNGFINFTMSKDFWFTSILKIINDENYGRSDIGVTIKDKEQIQQNVNVEFCSANPTGPLHLGHVRGAIWGNTISNILKFCGYNVTKEYYINDLGGQIEQLIDTSFARYKEACSQKFDSRDLYYPGEYLKEVGKDLKKRFGNSILKTYGNRISEILRRPVIQNIIKIIKNDLDILGIKFDNWIYESDIANSPLMDEAFEILKSQGLIYEGILDKPIDSDEDWESKPQMIFASSKFGDTQDRALKRFDGKWAYFAKDLAYHLHKIKRNYDWLILEVGIDHNGYKSRMEAGVSALSNGKQKFSFEFHNMVYLLDDGIQQKMSKRSGNIVGVKEIEELVGIGVLKFYILSKKHDNILDFDIKTARESSKNNPYFYIQYASARCSSILRLAEEKSINFCLEQSEFNDITISNEEKKLIKKLLYWPNCVEIAGKTLEPHRLNFYLEELANIFHGIWNLGNCDRTLRFINDDDPKVTKYRIMLVKATHQVISNGLKLIGIEPLKQM